MILRFVCTKFGSQSKLLPFSCFTNFCKMRSIASTVKCTSHSKILIKFTKNESLVKVLARFVLSLSQFFMLSQWLHTTCAFVQCSLDLFFPRIVFFSDIVRKNRRPHFDIYFRVIRWYTIWHCIRTRTVHKRLLFSIVVGLCAFYVWFIIDKTSMSLVNLLWSRYASANNLMNLNNGIHIAWLCFFRCFFSAISFIFCVLVRIAFTLDRWHCMLVFGTIFWLCLTGFGAGWLWLWPAETKDKATNHEIKEETFPNETQTKLKRMYWRAYLIYVTSFFFVVHRFVVHCAGIAFDCLTLYALNSSSTLSSLSPSLCVVHSFSLHYRHHSIYIAHLI